MYVGRLFMTAEAGYVFCAPGDTSLNSELAFLFWITVFFPFGFVSFDLNVLSLLRGVDGSFFRFSSFISGLKSTYLSSLALVFVF